MKPTAELTIIDRGATISYSLTVAGRLVWATRSYSTPEGRDGARERMRRWMHETGYRVVMAAEKAQERRKIA